MTSSPDTRAPREGALLRGALAARAVSYRDALDPVPTPSPVDRRATIRRAADQPVPPAELPSDAAVSNRPSFRLGDVYAEELDRLREQAHAEGFAAGHAEGMTAAESVVAETERAAAERLAEVQARWERRLVSATAALGAAADRLDEAALPIAEDIRDSILTAVVTLVEDLLGRELALAESPGLDALRRALTFVPTETPAVVRLHPDDLAEVPAEALAALPATISVVADAAIERAGAVAECGPQRIDAQLGAALERVQAVLAV
ncbi:FliH/SctL family protein [Petropleomorpha daqingensis]|uniref:Flagellar assembly protein FliH n=1 Tax=Petropleomorpha daqingensis TaxID=2026353 RepID=A0A853CK16_9ACTN|nr:FliH/SctL family protein [Petropleomorpha daqingensis]NYJ06333.1 flagellar assembly protein FliH [Petropleomorpha daqingensis]